MNAVEQYFGCECYCLNHIALFSYFPPYPEKGDENYDEDYDVIHLSVQTDYLFTDIFLNLLCRPTYWRYSFEFYFRENIFNRIPIVISYLLGIKSLNKKEIFDHFDFQNKDLPVMRKMFSDYRNRYTQANVEYQVSSESQLGPESYVVIDNDRWLIKFEIDRIDEDFPYRLGWEVKFRQRDIWGRIRYGCKYLFGRVGNEQHFQINESDAAHLQRMITVVENLNKND